MIGNQSEINRRTYASTLGIFLVMLLATAVMAIAPVQSIPDKTITKGLSPEKGGLGTIVEVKLTISGTETGEEVVVSDDLKGTGLSYIEGSFKVDGVPKIPYAKKGLIQYTLTADAIITFEVKVNEAYAWDDTEVKNTATAVWYLDGTSTGEDAATAEFIIEAFDSLNKGIGDNLEHETTATVGEDTTWIHNIIVKNPFEYTMTDCVIKDRFGAEIEIVGNYIPGEWYTDGASQGKWKYTTKGNSDKVFLTWEIGDIVQGGSAQLKLQVSTDENPVGWQEYTEPDTYDLNSGATLKFVDPEQDMQLSAYTGSITVEVTVLE